MSDHLQIDTDEVARVSTNLATIVRNLEAAEADANTLGSLIPVPELARAAEDFAHKWDDRRRELVEQVSALKEQAQAVADAFDEVDSQLVDALTRPPQPEGSGAGGPQIV